MMVFCQYPIIAIIIKKEDTTKDFVFLYPHVTFQGDNAKVLSPEIYGNISFNRYFLLNKKEDQCKTQCH